MDQWKCLSCCWTNSVKAGTNSRWTLYVLNAQSYEGREETGSLYVSCTMPALSWTCKRTSNTASFNEAKQPETYRQQLNSKSKHNLHAAEIWVSVLHSFINGKLPAQTFRLFATNRDKRCLGYWLKLNWYQSSAFFALLLLDPSTWKMAGKAE